MKRFDYDLVVIGSGDAGSEAALIAAKSGLNVALVEAKKWGGSNLNTSNVPFGAALNGAFTYKQALAGARFGISSANLRYNYPTLMNWKNQAAKRAGANSKRFSKTLRLPASMAKLALFRRPKSSLAKIQFPQRNS